MPRPWSESARRRSESESAQRGADLAACRRLLRGGSRTFYAASFLLPRAVREPACALYAFCRLADDAVDLDSGNPQVLNALRERLARAYAGRPLHHPADRAFADVVARFEIPRALPEALLEGFEWDLARRRYRDLPALHDYAARVAGSVGAMMSLLMGARTPELVARACDLGVAMQLTNIARDVGEDARAGRLYLPLDWLHAAGIDAQRWLAAPAHSDELAGVVERLLAEADRLYARAGAAVAGLPPACRPGIHAAGLVYAEIGREVRRRGHDCVTQRAVVSGARKAALLAAAVAASARARVDGPAPALVATRYLVEAAARPRQQPLRESARGFAAVAERIDRRAAWLVDLFDRLEREQRLRHAGARATRRVPG